MKKHIVIISAALTLLSFHITAQSIHRTACQGNLSRLDSLLQTTDINVKNNTESTLVHLAAYCRQSEVFNLLVERGAALDEVNKFGETPLLYAIQSRQAMMVRVLLEKGARVDIINENGQTPLFSAVQSNRKEIFDMVMAAKPDINLGNSALNTAVLNENLDFVKQLINDKTDVDVLNDRGNTALAIAIRQGSSDIVEFLISKNADRSKVRTYELNGEFLGQPKPGKEAEIFAPNIVSTEDFVHTPSFSADGKTLYYTAESRKYHRGTIMESKSKRGKWSMPKPTSIDGDYREIDPFISSDGSKLFYNSNRPINDGDSTRDNTDIWMVKRKGKKWSKPIHLGEDVNTEYDDWFPTLSKNGTLFFSTGPPRGSNIVYSEFKDGKYQKSIALSDSVNSESNDYDPIIAPDESFVIFSSNRPGGFGSVDLYVSFKKEDGSWTKAKNMGETINTSTIEFAPRLSADGNYFFFNRRGDIYWVDAQIIKDLK